MTKAKAIDLPRPAGEEKDYTLALVDMAAAINFCRDKAEDMNVTTSDVRRALDIIHARFGWKLKRKG